MKKRAKLLLMLLASVTMLTACGGEVPADGDDVTQEADGGESADKDKDDDGFVELVGKPIDSGNTGSEAAPGGETDVETPTDIPLPDVDPQIPDPYVEPDSVEGMYRSELTGMWIDESLKDQRPIACMIDNEITALDHYGVNSADIVYELMNSTANGRITRLMVVMKDWEKIEQLGSVRSARPTNFVLAAEYNAILLHDGGPYYINDYVKKNYTNNLSGGFARFSNGKASEFTEYITYNGYKNPTTGKSYAGLGSRIESAKYSTTYNSYYSGDTFTFNTNGVNLSSHSDCFDTTDIKLPYPHNKSELKYNATNKTYEYYVYGRAHVDPMDNNNITTFKNLILQECKYFVYDDHGYMIYKILDGGKGYYITEGKAIPITWTKKDDTEKTSYKDADGNEIELNVGKTYITLVPNDKFSEIEFN